MIIDVLHFRLASGVDEEEWLAQDRLAQTDFAYQQPGLLRRTTARGEGGSWAVITQWRSAVDADAAMAKAGQDPGMLRIMSMIEPGSSSTERYEPLG